MSRAQRSSFPAGRRPVASPDVVRHRRNPAAPTAPGLTRTISDDPLGGTVRRTVLPSGLRVLTEAIPAMRSVSFGIWVGVGSRDETPAHGRCLALPGAPALQGHPQAHRAGHLRRDRGGRRRDQRLHHQGIHLLLRAGARRGPAAGHRRDVRRWSPTRCWTGRRGDRARRDPRRDRHARRRARRRGARPLRRGHLRRPPARPADLRHRGDDHPDDPQADPELLPPPLHRRRRSSSRPPATSTTPPWSGWSAQALRRTPLDADPAAAGRPAGRPRRGTHASRPRSWCAPKDTEQAHVVLGCPGIARGRRAPVRPRRAQQRARRRHVQPAVPGDPGEARPGLLGLLLHHASTPTAACSASTPAARRARWTRCST